MSYEKKIWSDRQTEFPTRRKLIATNTTNIYDVERAEGTVYDAGDAFSASTMNDLENRIDNGKLDADFSNLLLEALKNSDVMRDYCYQVGTVIEFGNGVDPNETIGGTWEVFGPGRTSVCLDPDDTDFNELGKTGGSKTASYPLGNEGYAKMDVQSGSPFVWEYARTSVPSYSTTIKVTGGSGSGVSNDATNRNRGVPLGGSTGAGDNMQPYIVSLKWIRVA